MNIYVIGPVTGKESENREEFERVRVFLWTARTFDEVVIPHDLVKKDATWEQGINASIRHIIDEWTYSTEPNMDMRLGIAMLDGWEDSKGARIEHDLACALGIECRPWREYL